MNFIKSYINILKLIYSNEYNKNSFFDKLKNMGVYRKKFIDLGDSLVKSKKDLVEQNKGNFMTKVYRIYTYCLLDKMYNNFGNLMKGYRKFYGNQLFDRLKALLSKGQDFEYNGTKSVEKECPRTKLSFKAHVVNPKQQMMNDDNKDTNRILVPYMVNYLDNKLRSRKKFALDKMIDNDRAGRFCKLYKTYSNKRMIQPKKDLYDSLKKRSDYMDTYGAHILKLFLLLRKYYIHKTCEALTIPSQTYKLLYLIKLSIMHKNVAKQRFMREIIRKWRFSAFVKKMARRKLELMYKNLHLSYLQMANEVFGDEDSVNHSIIKEFERFGNGIGMFSNADPNNLDEEKYCKGVSKKYIFEPVVVDERKELDDNNDYYVDQEIEGGTTGKYKSETNRSKDKSKK